MRLGHARIFSIRALMSLVLLPNSCSLALKEWAGVLEAMRSGEQILLIRKGGLIEPGGGFQLLSPVFLYYPTYEHQTVNYVDSSYQHFVQEALTRHVAQEHIRFELFAHVILSFQVHNAATIERLSSFHIYNERFTLQRLKWQPEQPLMVVAVRTFQLSEPYMLPKAPHYAGCTSWVTLDTAIPLKGARPILDDPVFEARLAALKRLLSMGT